MCKRIINCVVQECRLKDQFFWWPIFAIIPYQNYKSIGGCGRSKGGLRCYRKIFESIHQQKGVNQFSVQGSIYLIEYMYIIVVTPLGLCTRIVCFEVESKNTVAANRFHEQYKLYTNYKVTESICYYTNWRILFKVWMPNFKFEVLFSRNLRRVIRLYNSSDKFNNRVG